MDLEKLKEQAALAALEEVRDGTALGLGTGSTVYWLLKHLGEGLKAGRWKGISGVPTSDRTAALCQEFEIPLTDLDKTPVLDLAIDGTDEVTSDLQLIKGLGGALLREKMVANAAKRFVIIADQTKRVTHLGERAPLPVEVVAFSHQSHNAFLRSLGAAPDLRCGCGGDPLLTDNGNVIVDCRFRDGIEDPHQISRALNDRPGVVDHGLFLDLCQRAILATSEGITEIAP